MELENIEDKQASPESVVGLLKKNINGHLRAIKASLSTTENQA